MSNEKGEILISDLPFEAKNNLENEGLAFLPRINSLTNNDKGLIFTKRDILNNTDKVSRKQLDAINPYSNEIELENLTPAIVNDLSKSGLLDYERRKGGYSSLDQMMNEIPEELGKSLFDILYLGRLF